MQMLAGWALLFQPSLFPFLPVFRYWIQVTFGPPNFGETVLLGC